MMAAYRRFLCEATLQPRRILKLFTFVSASVVEKLGVQGMQADPKKLWFVFTSINSWVFNNTNEIILLVNACVDKGLLSHRKHT